MSVVLCEKDDLASHTSSASSKLIHGGLRYLEHYEFGLVRKALIEREILLRAAPHIMWPLRFVLPHDKGQRPAWMIRIGLFLYDRLARRDLLPGSCSIDLRHHAAGEPLKPAFARGFIYSDGWVDDARLVVLNAIDAAAKGAKVFTRTCCASAQRKNGRWEAQLHSDNGALTVNARCLINATGPWTAHFLQAAVHRSPKKAMRLIKGSHIIIKRVCDHPYAYIFQHSDGRIVFALPYEQHFTLIGTTDIEYHGDANAVMIDPEEITYLCDVARRYFRQIITPADVVWSYSGVRPLAEDNASNASALTRDYRLELDMHGAPLLSVFGGKITTFRKLAEEALDMLASLLPMRCGSWTAGACLPGGDIFDAAPNNRAVLEFEHYVNELKKKYGWLPQQLVARYARAYGTRTDLLLRGRKCIHDMGEEILPGLYATEVEYLMQREWAVNAEDILWRRSKLGMHVSPASQEKLDTWIRTHRRNKRT